MRCSICDWSPTAQSFFNEGLSLGCGSNRLIKDPRTGDIVCSDCFLVYDQYAYIGPSKSSEMDGGIPLIDMEFDND